MRLLSFFTVLTLASLAAAGEPAPAMSPEETKALTTVVRHLIVNNLPDPAVSTKHNWGKQKDVTVRFDAERSGPFRWKFDPVKELKNDGHWTAFRLTAIDPAKSLAVELKDVATPETGKTTFTAVLSGPVNFGYEQQMWKSGVKLFSGETRGRCDATATLNCESVSRSDWAPGKLLPTQFLRVKVLRADLGYDKLRVDHTAGVGGAAAKVIGEGVVSAVKVLKPNLERDLIDKANAAVVKAGDSKEIKLDLERLVTGKK